MTSTIATGAELKSGRERRGKIIREKAYWWIIATALAMRDAISTKIRIEFIDLIRSEIVRETGPRGVTPAIEQQIEAILAEATEALDELRIHPAINGLLDITNAINNIIGAIIIKSEAIIVSRFINPGPTNGTIGNGSSIRIEHEGVTAPGDIG